MENGAEHVDDDLQIIAVIPPGQQQRQRRQDSPLRVQTKRGREKRIYDGNCFVFEKMSTQGDREFWRCDRRDSDKCKARLHYTLNGTVTKEINIHSHDPDPSLVKVKALKCKIKQRAVETMDV